MLASADLAATLSTAPAIALKTDFVRRVSAASLFGIKGPVPPPGEKLTAYSPNFFFVSGNAYRFNPPGLATLYLGEGESTATAETKQHPGARGFDFAPRPPDVMYHVSVSTAAILDLTDPAIVAALGTTADELLANWRLLSPRAPTQVLGQAVFDSMRFEGIRYQSAAKAKVGEIAACVAFFPARKRPESVVTVLDANGDFVQAL